MNKPIIHTSILCLLFAASLMAEEFHAYFTHLNSKEPFEETSRTESHADVVVRLGEGRLVFWRGTSYLPYWETPNGKWPLEEVIPRKGDGTDQMPDKINAFSHVDIVKDDADKIVVEWRYLPEFKGGNPPEGMGATKFVEERFTITPDGKVERIIKQGTPKLEDWQDPLNQTVIHLQLNKDGIETLKKVAASKSERKQAPVKGNPVKDGPPMAPMLHWSFDEGFGDQTKEDISGKQGAVAGHKTFWKKGVSGTAIAFDGYNTEVQAKADAIPDKLDQLTCSGWFVLGAYPWNLAPIIQKGEEKGFILGVDGYGKPCMHVKVGNESQVVMLDKTLERNRWYHLAGVCDAKSGKLQLYLDGELVKEEKIKPGEITTPNAPVRIGKVDARPITEAIRLRNLRSNYAFDGLLDEVSVYQKALKPEEIKTLFSHYHPGKAIIGSPDIQARSLPSFEGTGKFGAHYTHLKFYETWDALWRFGQNPDVVVEFDDNPSKFVFWRGAGYIPMLVNESGHWYSNEFNETWKRSGGMGCQEPMSDKEAYSNHARIIENTPARVVIHWRYAVKDVRHLVANYKPETGWADWSDWYFYIYPDGVATKLMKIWTHGSRDHEFHESMVIMGPNQHPEQVIETDQAIFIADMNGKTEALSWSEGFPKKADFNRKAVQVLNLKGSYDPFTIGFNNGSIFKNEKTDYAAFPNWNHWPVSQVTSDGRRSRFPDRTSHSSLTHLKFPGYIWGPPGSSDKPFYSKVMMEGMTDRKAGELIGLAKSWLEAPVLTEVKGGLNRGYIQHERAYHLVANAPNISFNIPATPQQPIENLALVVYNWNQDEEAQVELNGKPAGSTCKQGIVRDPKGRQALVLWFDYKSTEPASIRISGAQPEETSEFVDSSLKGSIEKGDGMLSIKLKADMFHGVFNRRFMFECTKGMEWNSGWQIDNRVHLHELAADTEFSFRFKIRDFYGNVSGWSEELTYTTPALPKPGVLGFKESFVIEGPAKFADIKIEKQGEVRAVTDKNQPSYLFGKGGRLIVHDEDQLKSSDAFTWMAWVKTTRDGVLISRADDEWTLGDNALFIRDGKLQYEIGGRSPKHSTRVGAKSKINDGRWHHVAVRTKSTGRRRAELFIDGKGEVRWDIGERKQDPGIPLRIGAIVPDQLKVADFVGQLKDLRFYDYALTNEEVARIYKEAKD